MVYLGAPVTDLYEGGHSTPVAVLAGAGLAAFVAVYVRLIFRYTKPLPGGFRGVYVGLAALLLLALVPSFALGSAWLVLFVYFSVAAGAVLPSRASCWVIPGTAAVLVALGLHLDDTGDLWPALFIPALLGGFAMVGIRRMIRTTRELREARAAVAHLAASDERLRLARDLHDLLGHSLSLITLKSELAGRMLPGEPEAAAAQVADIERVSRQALVDVREAVSDYRRPTLRVELASAATAFGAAGISARLPEPAALSAALHPDQESALAWALREACTNVVRHSGASRCTVTLTEQADETVCLAVTDDGRGADSPSGNGLTGLAERLALADGALETGPGVRGGFQLRAVVPAGVPAAVAAEGPAAVAAEGPAAVAAQGSPAVAAEAPAAARGDGPARAPADGPGRDHGPGHDGAPGDGKNVAWPS
ncbi:sensor histidine kinase [Streptomyces sp. HNM0575]|nr:sensor histidine kinase [Streptomyces sp. HNM0575]